MTLVYERLASSLQVLGNLERGRFLSTMNR